ncbi:MAG: PHP domain-containing protein [Methylacidiphilales bacterium]|nr:PHP domain-containing protein [Candidatus Methylacidiphilales bacterium]
MGIVPFYRVELHSHCQGDPIDSHLGHTIFEHIDQAKAVGLDAIAVTWHQKVCDNPDAFDYARDRGILLIPGMEADLNRRHLVVLNLKPGDLPGDTTWDEVRALRKRKPEVFMLAPHPFYPHPSCLGREMNDHIDCIDAVEWCMLHVNWLPGRVNPNLRVARWAHQYNKPVVACSDSHSLNTIGKNASTVEADALTPEALFAGIRAGRVAFHRRSLDFIPFMYEAGRAIVSQPRTVGRWVKKALRARPV